MNTKTLNNQVYFVRSFGSLQGTGLRPSEVVQVVRRAMDDWPVTPQGSKGTTKTGSFQEIPVFLKKLFLGSKPNFLNPRITTTTCKRGTYNDFHPQTNQKSKPNPNPI